MRTRSSMAPSSGVFKSPSKLLAEQLETITFGKDEEEPHKENVTEKKLRSAFRSGRKSCFTENIPVSATLEPRKLLKTPSPPKKNIEEPKTGKSRRKTVSSALNVADKGVREKSTSPAPDTPAAAYHDVMLPSFTSFGRRKGGKAAVPAKRRTKKMQLDATVDKTQEDGQVNEDNSKKESVKIAAIDLSWMNVDDVEELIAPELAKRRMVAEQLMRRYRNQFNRWVVQLLSGFNLLLHGLGSKRLLLDEFSTQKLLPGGFDIVEFDAYRPDFSFSDFIKELYFNYCRLTSDYKISEAEMIRQVVSHLSSNDGVQHVVLVVHSLDGVEARNLRKFQQTLALLTSKCHRVHVVASADHVNFALMWDSPTVEMLRWLFVEAPTFEPPLHESRSNDCSLLRSVLRAHSTTGAHVTLTSVRHVVFSLTPNAIRMFVLLCYVFVEKQARRAAAVSRARRRVEDPDQPIVAQNNDVLMPLSVLYKQCRDQFIVSSFDIMLKHLRELYDHTLAKQVKHPDDGVDCLQMNLSAELASSFLDECRRGDEYANFLESLATDIEL